MRLLDKLRLLILCLFLSCSLFSQRSYEYQRAHVQTDTSDITYAIERTNSQHHIAVLTQEEFGWKLHTWRITKAPKEWVQDAFVLDSITTAIYSGETPWFDYFFGAQDGFWTYTEVWSATIQTEEPFSSRVYLNWVFARHEGIEYKYLESLITENISPVTGIRTIVEFYVPR